LLIVGGPTNALALPEHNTMTAPQLAQAAQTQLADAEYYVVFEGVDDAEPRVLAASAEVGETQVLAECMGLHGWGARSPHMHTHTRNNAAAPPERAASHRQDIGQPGGGYQGRAHGAGDTLRGVRGRCPPRDRGGGLLCGAGAGTTPVRALAPQASALGALDAKAHGGRLTAALHRAHARWCHTQCAGATVVVRGK